MSIEDKQIKEAISLLRKNNYIVKKITPSMERDSQRCIDCEDIECIDCACSVCIWN